MFISVYHSLLYVHFGLSQSLICYVYQICNLRFVDRYCFSAIWITLKWPFFHTKTHRLTIREAYLDIMSSRTKWFWLSSFWFCNIHLLCLPYSITSLNYICWDSQFYVYIKRSSWMKIHDIQFVCTYYSLNMLQFCRNEDIIIWKEKYVMSLFLSLYYREWPIYQWPYEGVTLYDIIAFVYKYT